MNEISSSYGSSSSSSSSSEITLAEKHALIVEYLKELPPNVKASMEDIENALHIDLDEDLNVLDMLKSNSKINITFEEESYLFQYAREYQLRDISELKEMIKKVRNGISIADIEHCYDNIMEDCKALIVGGEEVIACKNSDKKTVVLYPRGKPFYTRLSGTMTARPGSSHVKTSESEKDEIRRGDAISIGGSWYRVSCSVGKGSEREQSQRSTAPLSVTSDKEMSDKNVYFEPFTDEILPLDGDFYGSTIVNERGKRHGCTNDIRKIWQESLVEVKKFKTDGELEDELLRLGLITVKSPVEVKKTEEKGEKKKKWKRWGKK